MLRFISNTLYEYSYKGIFEDISIHEDKWKNSSQFYREKEQLRKFNEVWKYAQEKYTFYKNLKKNHFLPSYIDDIREIQNFPVLKKKDIQEYETKIFDESDGDLSISTGGSTGKPLRIPASYMNRYRSLRNAAVARRYYGCELSDPKLLIWGHAHLMGQGHTRIIRKFNRSTKDFLSNTKRLSAYDLSARCFEQIILDMQNKKFKSLITYASFLRELFAYIEKCYDTREIAQYWPDLTISTAEMLLPEIAENIQEKLQTKVVNEYGSAEFGPLAYSMLEFEQLRYFWWSFYMNMSTSGATCVTDLEPVEFPLINYDIEDKVVPVDGNSIETVFKVHGRLNDVVPLKTKEGDRIRVHSEFFTHMLKNMMVRKYQVVVYDDRTEIRCQMEERELEKVREYVLNEMAREFEEVDLREIVVAPLIKRVATRAGKEKFIFDERGG